jgi:hypothetical protein
MAIVMAMRNLIDNNENNKPHRVAVHPQLPTAHTDVEAGVHWFQLHIVVQAARKEFHLYCVPFSYSTNKEKRRNLYFPSQQNNRTTRKLCICNI